MSGRFKGVIGGGCCDHLKQPYGKRPSRGVCRQVCALREPVVRKAPSSYTRAAWQAGRAVRSMVKTGLGIDRPTDKQVEARLDVCRQCPGGHVIWKEGDVHTCGPMLESMKRAGEGTCGCILHKKARDLSEVCPFGWWPKSSDGRVE